MAFSDWSLIQGAGSEAFSSALNSSLSNPLTIGSSYCRYVTVSNPGGAWATGGYSVSSSYQSGQLYNVANTKAIRVQGYLRLSAVPNANSRAGAWIGAKLHTDLGNFNNYQSGYCLGIKAINSSQVAITTMFNGVLTNPNLESVSLNTWYGLRLEVYPIGASADRIKAYRESTPGSNVWNLLSDVTIANTSGLYTNWGENRKNGFFFLHQAEYDGQFTTGYVDLMSVSVANAPNPIP